MPSNEEAHANPVPQRRDRGQHARRFVPPLRREAVMVGAERQKAALLTAFCSLMGVVLGFGLGAFASASHCEHMHGRAAMHQIADRGEVAWLGVEVRSGNDGAVVTRVFANSPAESVGLRAGDTIVQIGRYRVTDAAGLVRAIRLHGIGSRVHVITDGIRARHFSVELSSIQLETLERLR